MPSLLLKDRILERAELATKLKDATTAVNAAVSDFNAERTVAFVTLQSAVEAYNQAVVEAWTPVDSALRQHAQVIAEIETFLNEVTSELQDKFDKKSEKWTLSEQGESFTSALSEWEAIPVDEIDLQAPDDIELDEPDDVDSVDDWEEFDKLPTEY